MREKVVNYIWLYASMICYLLMSLSFLLMPAYSHMDGNRAQLCQQIAGGAFWLFLMLGSVAQLVLAVGRRKRQMQSGRRQRIGVLSFFQNIGGSIADSVTIISFIGFVVALLITNSRGYICYVFLSVFVFSFCMHCILNGKIFYYITKNIE